jgi:hypothetical protein
MSAERGTAMIVTGMIATTMIAGTGTGETATNLSFKCLVEVSSDVLFGFNAGR